MASRGPSSYTHPSKLVTSASRAKGADTADDRLELQALATAILLFLENISGRHVHQSMLLYPMQNTLTTVVSHAKYTH